MIRKIIPSKFSPNFYVPTINSIIVNEKVDGQEEAEDILDFDELIIEDELVFSDNLINNNIKAIEIPLTGPESVSEQLSEMNIPAEIRPTLTKLLVEKYPDVVSTHNLDAGDLSRLLGQVSIKLKEGEQFPRNKKVYALSNQDQEHLDTLLQFMEKHDLIKPAKGIDRNYGYGAPAYLLPRKNNFGRLIVDFSQINPLL